MPDHSNATFQSTRNLHPLVSPVDALDEPDWLRRADPLQRKLLAELRTAGRQARAAAMEPFTFIGSLAERADVKPSQYRLKGFSPAQFTGNEDYPEYLAKKLQEPALRSARIAAYLATLREESKMAELKGDLRDDGKKMLQQLIDAFALGSSEAAEKGTYLEANFTLCASLLILDTIHLPQIILIGPDLDDAPCIAYVPGHPRHPIKQHRSRAAFYASLRRELLRREFQQYVQRFVAMPDQPSLFAALRDNDTLIGLPMKAVALTQRLGSFVYAQMVERLLADARYLLPATPEKIRDLENLLFDFPTAIEEHLMIGAGVGISAGEEDEGRSPSDCIEPLRWVRLPNNQEQRWRVNLIDYQADELITTPGEPDAQGLYTFTHRYLQGEQKAIRINEHFYRVQQDSEGNWELLGVASGISAYRSYRPRLYHNGHGAWHHGLERPEHWGRLSLLRRLGPLSLGLSDEQLLELGRISGVSNTQLRQVYLEDRPVPALLHDMMTRARIRIEVGKVMKLVAQGQPVPEGYAVEDLEKYYLLLKPKRNRTSRSPQNTPSPDTGQCSAESTCASTTAELYRRWWQRLALAIFAHRYELAQVPVDIAVQALQISYPLLPLRIAQDLLDQLRPQVARDLMLGVIALPLAERAIATQAQVRLARALEGIAEPFMANTDSAILAFRLLEFLPGWQVGTALLLRQGDTFGLPLASLGNTDIETTSIYLNDEGWHAVSSTQVLHNQDTTELGFYRSVLYALGETRRVTLGFGLNEPARLRQQLMILAQARPQRSCLLLDIPIDRTWLTSQRQPRQLIRNSWALLNREPAPLRLQAMLGNHPDSANAAGNFIRLLLRQNVAVGTQISRLEREHTSLTQSLAEWVAQEPDSDLRAERQNVQRHVLNAWSASILQQPMSLVLNHAALNTLPPLPVGLPAVQGLFISEMQLNSIPGNFLQSFPNLLRLELTYMEITELPQVLGNLQLLQRLDLTGTRITPQALSVISRLPHLTHLDLNDLDTGPQTWTAQQMVVLSTTGALQHLSMDRSHISFGPGAFAALANLPSLHYLSLVGNRIILSAADSSELASLIHLRHLDLSTNPLGRAPDLRRMQELRQLRLTYARFERWPEGLERLRHIEFALFDGTHIAQVPAGAGRVPGLQLSRQAMDEPTRQRFDEEMRAAGNPLAGRDPHSDDETSSSDEETRAQQRLRAPALLQGMPAAEQACGRQLMADTSNQSLEFQALLVRISQRPEARIPGYGLLARIQAVIRAAFTDDMRQALFNQANEAVTCADRDALVFSQLEDLAEAGRALSRSADENAAAELIALAVSQWRVQRLREHVATQIGQWRHQGHVIDEVEIELYFRRALGTRLSLRNPPGEQAFPEYTEWVTPAMLELALERVLDDQAQLLPTYINEQPYWERYLDAAYPAQTSAILGWRNEVGEYLDALASNDQLPSELTAQGRYHAQQVLVASGRLAPDAELIRDLRLGSAEYRDAYAVLLQRVREARLALTQALLRMHAVQHSEPQAGPSWRP